MIQTGRHKLAAARGISRLAMLLLLAVAAAAGITAVLQLRGPAGRADAFACELELDKLQKLLPPGGEESLGNGRTVLSESGITCPSGGDLYVIVQDGKLVPVCGLHATDTALRTQINAEQALGQLRASVRISQLLEDSSQAMELKLNALPLTAQEVEELPGLVRGTASTGGYDGTVCFYRIAGGEISRFCYADPDHCAVWQNGIWMLDGKTVPTVDIGYPAG